MRSIQSRYGHDHAFNPHNNLLYSNFELVHFTHYMLQTCYTWCIQLEDIWLIYFFIHQSSVAIPWCPFSQYHVPGSVNFYKKSLSSYERPLVG